MLKLSAVMILCFATAGPVAAQDVPWRTDYNVARKQATEKA